MLYLFFFFSLRIMYTRFLEKGFTKSTFTIHASIAIRKQENILRAQILLHADRIYIFYYLKTEHSISPTSVMSTGVQPSKRRKSRLYAHETQAIRYTFCSFTWTVTMSEFINYNQHHHCRTPAGPYTPTCFRFAKIASTISSKTNVFCDDSHTMFERV